MLSSGSGARRRNPWRVRAAVLALTLAASACSGSASRPVAARGAAQGERPAAGPADPLAAEYGRAGDDNWGVSGAPTSVLAGYVRPASVRPGGVLELHVRSIVPTVHVAAYRNGWYGGKGARLVWQRDLRALPPAPPRLLDPATRTWTASWPESTRLDTAGWPPGHYLLVARAGGRGTWAPFTVTSPSFRGRMVLLTEDTTWQAYNAYGGASLYHGPDGATRTRAYAVSFDRPLDYGNGAGDYPGNELPLIQLAEKLRLPLAYATDTDLQAAPGLLDGAAAVVSLGHDEYWSAAMREQLRRARDTTGTNLAFFGANAIYRHIRLQPLDGRPNRLEVDYKSAALDPVTASDPASATSDWPKPPVPRDGDQLTGASYRCNPVDGPLVVARPDSWLTRGLGLSRGQQLPRLLGSEYDEIIDDRSRPRAIESIFHSPVTCSGNREHADLAFYTVPGGAAGVDVGTSTWVCVLNDVCGDRRIDPQARRAVTEITSRVLRAFARSQAGLQHPVGS